MKRNAHAGAANSFKHSTYLDAAADMIESINTGQQWRHRHIKHKKQKKTIRRREREREGEVEEKKNKATDEIKLVTKERCMIHQQKEKYLLTSYS